jgi:hypothetical protein
MTADMKDSGCVATPIAVHGQVQSGRADMTVTAGSQWFFRDSLSAISRVRTGTQCSP